MPAYGPYPDGTKARYGDPLRIYRRLLTGLGGDPNKLLERFEVLEDDEARDKVVGAAGWAFEMVPFDPATGVGADEGLVEGVLRDFLGWMEKNVTWAGTTPTWPQYTAPVSLPSNATRKPGCGSG